MKIHGGYSPIIAGRPASIVETAALPKQLSVSMSQFGMQFDPLVKRGDAIAAGAPLAAAIRTNSKVLLPSPANGTISLSGDGKNGVSVVINTTNPKQDQLKSRIISPSEIKPEVLREILTESSLSSLLWSSATQGPPDMINGVPPKAIIITCLSGEPFRARGKVILRRSWATIVKGMRFLPRLMADYGTVEVVLTERTDAVAKMIAVELSGFAWAHFHSLPPVYPVEDPRVLLKALLATRKNLKKSDTIWVADLQAMEAIGAFLGEGRSTGRRIITVGGPAAENPRHLDVPIGTPLSLVASLAGQKPESIVLRGGLMAGEPIDTATDSVKYDDDAFFFLPVENTREFMSFVRPGFDRSSYIPCFMSAITGAPDTHITNGIRGERRPCIACGACENVCPMELLPQVIHRLLYRDALDEAVATGVEFCSGCGLCTYVCPSKIELSHQFQQANQQVTAEKLEAEAARQEAERREERELKAQETSDDWLK